MKSQTMSGFIVTWDVDSDDTAMCTRLRRFVFGRTVVVDGRTYRYRGFVELEGVRYLGQSVLFGMPNKLDILKRFLVENQVDYQVIVGSLGPMGHQ